MMWIALVLNVSLLLAGVAVHRRRMYHIQKQCMCSIESIRNHSDRMLQQCKEKYEKRIASVDAECSNCRESYENKIKELENKLRVCEQQKFDEVRRCKNECENLSLRCDRMNEQAAELNRENQMLIAAIGKVKEALGE